MTLLVRGMDYRSQEARSAAEMGGGAPDEVEALDQIVDRIILARANVSENRAALVGISGIDGSGKGFVSLRLAKSLIERSINVALISADDWLNLSQISLDRDGSAEHFYRNAIRFDEMFERLVFPLRGERQIDLVADCGDAKAKTYRRHRYRFRGIDVVLLEGILLFKAPYDQSFDLKIWIECSFETALQRAIVRGQEGLPPAETRRAFENTFFPAQRIHLERDNPRAAADLIFVNDGSGSEARFAQ